MITEISQCNYKNGIFYCIDSFMGKIIIYATWVKMTFNVLESYKGGKTMYYPVGVQSKRAGRDYETRFSFLQLPGGECLSPSVNSLSRKVDESQPHLWARVKLCCHHRPGSALSPQSREQLPQRVPRKECQRWFKPSPSNTSRSLEEIPQRPFCTIITRILKRPCTHMLKTPAWWVKLSITEV